MHFLEFEGLGSLQKILKDSKKYISKSSKFQQENPKSKNMISISPTLIDRNPSKFYEKSLAISLRFPRFIFMYFKKMRKFIGSLGIFIIFLASNFWDQKFNFYLFCEL
jgi:hypothetical protein